MQTKKELRKQILEKLNRLSEQSYKEKSRRIARRLFSTSEWKKARTVGITISRFPEVDTRGIIKQAWREGKRVAVPKCLPAVRKMEFYLINNFDEVESGYFGLLEPVILEKERLVNDEIDFLIVPGLMFTPDGYRLGFGGGYYDRFLPFFKGKTVSLAFKEQLTGELPVEEHDVRVAQIISENESFICFTGE